MAAIIGKIVQFGTGKKCTACNGSGRDGRGNKCTMCNGKGTT